MELWAVGFIPRHQGLWVEFLATLARWGAQLQVGGRVEVPWRAVKLSINSSLQEWLHMTRQCTRLDHLHQAQRQNAVTFDYDLDKLDWEALKAYQGAASGMQALLANCEHGCDSRDDPHHRLHHCTVTAGLRRFVGITPELIEAVDGMKKCSRDCAIWEYPALALEAILPPGAPHGLWLTRQTEWLQQLQDVPVDPVVSGWSALCTIIVPLLETIPNVSAMLHSYACREVFLSWIQLWVCGPTPNAWSGSWMLYWSQPWYIRFDRYLCDSEVLLLHYGSCISGCIQGMRLMLIWLVLSSL